MNRLTPLDSLWHRSLNRVRLGVNVQSISLLLEKCISLGFGLEIGWTGYQRGLLTLLIVRGAIGPADSLIRRLSRRVNFFLEDFLAETQDDIVRLLQVVWLDRCEAIDYIIKCRAFIYLFTIKESMSGAILHTVATGGQSA